MSSQLIVIVGFIIGIAILFFDFPRYDPREQEYWWAVFAYRRSKCFSVVTLIALFLAWWLQFPVLVYLFLTMEIFFVLMDIFLGITLWLQKKRDRMEGKK